MDNQEEVLIESWLYKLKNQTNKKAITLSSPWKKKYFILKRNRENVLLLYYDTKPKSGRDVPKGKIPLNAWFRVEKKYNFRNKPFVCEITTPGRQMYLGSSDEKIFHLFAFFLQVQIKLKEDLEDECFVVRPENTEDIRKIGGKGNMCMLHISRWGITVALQLSKCVIGQWPLKTIKSYESTGRGHFAFEAGRLAPMGEGHYSFSTRVTQDVLIYDTLDKYVMEAAGLRESTTPEGPVRPPVETLDNEYQHLRSFTHVLSDPNFISHIRRISRDIYDHLWQHLGGERGNNTSSTSDLSVLSDSLSRQDLSRSESAAAASSKASPPTLMPMRPAQQPVELPQHQYQNSSVEVPSGARPIRSQYMQMGSTDNGTPSPPNLPNSTPPPSFIEAMQRASDDRFGYTRAASTLERNKNTPMGSHVRKLVSFQKQHSRSMDDLSDHWRGRNPYVYNNNSYEAGEVSPLHSHTVGFTYTYADKAGTVPKRYKDTESENRYVRESKAPGAGVEFTQGATAEDYAVPYTQVRPSYNTSRLRRSVSNPELLESALRDQDRTMRVHHSNAENTQEHVFDRFQRGYPPLSFNQANNSNNNSIDFTRQLQPPKVTSPAVQSIQSSGKTRVFKKQASQDSVGMTKYTPRESGDRNMSQLNSSDHNTSFSLQNNVKSGTSETLC